MLVFVSMTDEEIAKLSGKTSFHKEKITEDKCILRILTKIHAEILVL